MGGFVVTCVDGGSRRGRSEILSALEMAVYSLALESDGASSEGRVSDVLAAEAAEARKSQFGLLGGHKGTEVLWVRNSSKWSEMDVYNALVSGTKRVQFIRRVIPVAEIFTLTIDNIVRMAKKLAGEMPVGASFRVSLCKRLCSHISSEFIIATVAKEFDFKVDLINPDRIVVIEIARDLCGMGLIKPCPGNFNLTRDPSLQ
ncbi:tRNA acetyltransferase TAN1 [Nematocida homosporus]|uniref:tRNA acetyltransferase TAN1 n=1 Tax=Nematocida homosporus TaxID=1912981 RepID=UPI00221F46D4|nr:tRNA acetyltransferase TAN1 [Nematocida homosporus]KAI5185399.1 tRNA acetyltransferase TAN1 [Nematocida homosporus]